MKLEQENDMWICGTCILILIVEMASKPFSDFCAGPFAGGWIRMIFHHQLWCALNRQGDWWE